MESTYCFNDYHHINVMINLLYLHSVWKSRGNEERVTINVKVAKFLHRLPAVDKIRQNFSCFLYYLTKDKEILKMKKNEKDFTVKVPILDLPFMSDEEWNRLAYRNLVERNKAI